MSKELEAFENVKRKLAKHYAGDSQKIYEWTAIEDDLNTIEKALKPLNCIISNVVKINSKLINVKNIAYTSQEYRETDGYDWRPNIRLNIYFISTKEPLTFTFFDFDEFDRIIKMLEQAIKNE